MMNRLHPIAGFVALITLVVFWGATLVAEVFLDDGAIRQVKALIVDGLFVLIPAMALAGLSGRVLSRGRAMPLADAKTKSMKILALNGFLIMIPAALFLKAKATAGEIDSLFYLVQAIELGVGLVQMRLVFLNIRTGLHLAGRTVDASSP
ncbi:hypothetical protein [Pararhodospirillum oryzae]|uniref:Lipoprotein n=1 Tax=Pararhodospirillum oryzae TaxID=478448 RepID=A0A512H7B3_9PROT|nr:hypothetical protein [Pararhodospirillum oryzae]GEO81324.1 lipoprotein [Pararhodospirillum oryzae]